MKINFAFLTGERSDYGIAKPLLRKLNSDPDINMMVFPTGMHLLKEFGYTVNEIMEDGFKTTEFIYTYNSIREKSHQFSNSVKCIYDVMKEYTIDIVYIIGDRIEAYSGALAAHFLNIPIAHYGGGAITQGAVDNVYRYNITNLSDIHFATSKNNYQRLLSSILLNKNSVYFTGSTAIDGIMKYKRNSTVDMPDNEYALMTFHPVTVGNEPIADIMNYAIDILLKNDRNVLITYPNNDTGYEKIIDVILEWKSNERVIVKESLGVKEYYSALENCLFVIGNSSSGLIEAPYFNKPVLNIGSRQDGRDKDLGVYNVAATIESVDKTLATGFRSGWSKVACSKLYGEGDGVGKIINALKAFVNK